MLEEPGDVILEKYLCFNFQESNNQAEYVAVIAGLRLAREVGASHMLVQTNSQLVASQIRRRIWSCPNIYSIPYA